MVSETSLAAQQCRLREWAEQIRDCQNRAEGMIVIEWCSRNGITKANYYYRLRRVRAACLEQFPEETAGRQVIPVPSEFLSFQENNTPAISSRGLELSLNGICIHVMESSSMKLLSDVLEVVRNAQ